MLHANILCGMHANSTRQPQDQTGPKSLYQSPETAEGFSPCPTVPWVRSSFSISSAAPNTVGKFGRDKMLCRRKVAARSSFAKELCEAAQPVDTNFSSSY